MNRKQYLPAMEKSNLLHMPTYYYLKTGNIPSVLTHYRIDVQKLYDKIISSYTLSDEQVVKSETFTQPIGRLKISTAYIELPHSIFLYMCNHQGYVELYYDHTTNKSEIEKAQSIIFDCLKNVTDEKKVGLIVCDSGGSLEVRDFNIANQHDDINDLYNDDFLSFHEQMLEKLQSRKANGILLLHGLPGTGKSSYIRHLIGSIKKNFIYLPSSLANHIGQPSFLHFLSKHSNSILIIEDGEELLMKRRTDSKPAISNLLNLSDGLLSDCLKVQVIATFNCDYSKIDDAFLRKGRILGRYCFDELSVAKSNSLLKKLEFPNETTKPMTLAEIFNQTDKDYTIKTKRTPLGFTTTQPSN